MSFLTPACCPDMSRESAVENALLQLAAIVAEPWFPDEVDRVLRINHTCDYGGWAEEVMAEAKKAGWNMSFHGGIFHIWRPNT